MARLPAPPSQEDTLKELLGSSQRDMLPLRYTFAQKPDKDKNWIAGPLAALVRRGVASALEQYLLLHARAAGRPDPDDDALQYDVSLESRVWARALGLPDDDSGLRTVQRNWRALEAVGLVNVQRKGRVLTATLLREDGSGAAYTHPGGTRDSRYLKLPYSYWLEGYSEKLKLPGKAMLLIALTLPDWFSLPYNKGPHWYGIGASTVERGLRELRRLNLIEAHLAWRKAPLLAQGWTQDLRYCLRPPFGPSGKVAKTAPPELRLLLGVSKADSSPQTEGQTDKPKRRKPATPRPKSSAATPPTASPSTQADSSKGRPMRRKPATKKAVDARTGGAGRKPSPTKQSRG
jgi:hypothetical protein